ncbi:MAG: prolipoprotein diacylglyceryl transferase, partial [Myxococcales bacterium]|nr:prolipoprotein diacylglyceryl transferase [Myxococcales bacterium]
MHPVLFEIPMPWGDQPVYSYGVMLGTSLLVAWYTIMWLGAKKESLSAELMRNTFIVTAISAIVSSRLLYVATNPDEFHSFGDVFNLQGGGLVAYGGFLG